MTQSNSYPTVPVQYLMELCRTSTVVSCEEIIGKSVCFIVKGRGPISERMKIFNSDVQEVEYYYATAIATKIKKVSELMKWLEENKNWKEGAYIATLAPISQN